MQRSTAQKRVKEWDLKINDQQYRLDQLQRQVWDLKKSLAVSKAKRDEVLLDYLMEAETTSEFAIGKWHKSSEIPPPKDGRHILGCFTGDIYQVRWVEAIGYGQDGYWEQAWIDNSGGTYLDPEYWVEIFPPEGEKNE